MRRRESSTFSNILFSLLIFLFIGKLQSNNLKQVCSSLCGDIKNISYPFRLKGDPAGCGEPNFELSCQSNKTIVQLHTGKYYVKEISYSYQLMTVVDVALANGSCGALPSQPLSISETLNYDHRTGMSLMTTDFWNTGGKYGYYTETKFLKCSRYFCTSVYIRVPCFSGNQSYYVDYGNHPISYGQDSFSVISSVPTLLSIQTNPSYETIKNLLHVGE